MSDGSREIEALESIAESLSDIAEALFDIRDELRRRAAPVTESAGASEPPQNVP